MTEKTKKPISDEKTAASSYILTFYQEVMQLSNYFGQYKVLLKKFKFKEGSSGTEKLSDSDKEFLKKQVESITIYLEVVYMKYRAMVKTIKELNEDKELVAAYSKIQDTFVIKVEDLDQLVFRFNVVLAEKIMKGLLQSSNDIVDDVFKE